MTTGRPNHDLEKTMPTQPQSKQRADQEKQERQQMRAAIGKHVMHALGQPGDLHSVQVRHLWEDHYRVNVLVTVDTVSAKVAHSYFLVTDGGGNILVSTPNITKHY